MKIDSQKVFRLLEGLEEKHQDMLETLKSMNCDIEYQKGYVDAIQEVLDQINFLVDDARSNS